MYNITLSDMDFDKKRLIIGYWNNTHIYGKISISFSDLKFETVGSMDAEFEQEIENILTEKISYEEDTNQKIQIVNSGKILNKLCYLIFRWWYTETSLIKNIKEWVEDINNELQSN